MSTRCTYLSSEDWNQRLNRYVSKAWDLETFLHESPQHTADGEVIDELAAELDVDQQTVATLPIGQVLEAEPTALETTLNDVRQIWQAKQDDLPEQCPHPVHDDHDKFCVCHSNPQRRDKDGLTSKDVREWLLKAVHTAGRENCFVGARLGGLDFTNAQLRTTDNQPLDFRYADVRGPVSCANATFSQEVLFKGADLGIDTTPRHAEQAPTFGNHYVDFIGEIDFMGARFERTADFKFVTFGGKARFNSTVFDGPAMFNYAQFRDKADFMAATCNGKTDFSKSQFDDDAFLNGTYNGAAIFNYATFEGDVDIWSTTFQRKAEFWAVSIGGQLNAQYAAFNAAARFTEATFGGHTTFEQAVFDGPVYFKRVAAASSIDLTETKISGGTISLPDANSPCYDLRYARVGDVSLEAPREKYDDLFEYLYIKRTKFDGFEFADYTSALRPDWHIHTNNVPEATCTEPITTDTADGLADLEATYLKAKTGATGVGHNKAASEFFFHEMQARRKQYGSQIWHADTIGNQIRAALNWTSNTLLGVTSGYGERPRRVVGTSMFVVGFFAVLYWLLATSADQADASGVEYLLLSIQSFITFILGDVPQQPTFGLELITAVQGFIGAFLIALLVFTLTRSVHR